MKKYYTTVDAINKGTRYRSKHRIAYVQGGWISTDGILLYVYKYQERTNSVYESQCIEGIHKVDENLEFEIIFGVASYKGRLLEVGNLVAVAASGKWGGLRIGRVTKLSDTVTVKLFGGSNSIIQKHHNILLLDEQTIPMLLEEENERQIRQET